MDIWKISSIGSYLSLHYRRLQSIEYKRQREYDASEGVTTEDLEVRHSTTGCLENFFKNFLDIYIVV